MSTIIYPRSPREMMDGWFHLPRFIDKIRLHLAGKLHADYQNNFTKGFDAAWLKAAGLDAQDFIAVVKNTVTDGEVCDWVRTHVKKTSEEKAKFNQFAANRGNDDDQMRALIAQRKQEAGLGSRQDILTFFDFIDADEKRS